MKKLIIFSLVFVFSLSVFANEYKNIKFNWTLIDSATNGVEIINVFLDYNKIKKIDNYTTYWVKFENSSGTTIVREAVDCIMHKQTLMGGMQYDKNGNTLYNVIKYEDKDLKTANDFKDINFNNDKDIGVMACRAK